jgi:hypothetical protein
MGFIIGKYSLFIELYHKPFYIARTMIAGA